MFAASGSDFFKQVSYICLTRLPYFSPDTLHLQIAPDSSLRPLLTFCYPFHFKPRFCSTFICNTSTLLCSDLAYLAFWVSKIKKGFSRSFFINIYWINLYSSKYQHIMYGDKKESLSTFICNIFKTYLQTSHSLYSFQTTIFISMPPLNTIDSNFPISYVEITKISNG